MREREREGEREREREIVCVRERESLGTVLHKVRCNEPYCRSVADEHVGAYVTH